MISLILIFGCLIYVDHFQNQVTEKYSTAMCCTRFWLPHITPPLMSRTTSACNGLGKSHSACCSCRLFWRSREKYRIKNADVFAKSDSKFYSHCVTLLSVSPFSNAEIRNLWTESFRWRWCYKNNTHTSYQRLMLHKQGWSLTPMPAAIKNRQISAWTVSINVPTANCT